jgi:phytol kinase
LIPPFHVALLAVAVALVTSALVGSVAAGLRTRGVRVAYTRKIFHFGVFTGAAAVHAAWGLPGTNVYGAVTALAVLLVVFRGDGNPFYEALARETDRPRRSLFIVVPLITTAVGGLASALLAGPYAAVGYLVAGWGDAVGEPVGSRWGRHTYRVPSLGGVAARRSWEGSTAVFVVSWAAAVLALWTVGAPAHRGLVALACAGVSAVVEAVSHHGTDNLTVQIATSLTANWLVG